MDGTRQDPDRLLEAIRREEENQTRGHLKIFFGYAAGVGKTYAMLEAAHAAQRRGIDVVVGYVEPHSRPKTTALLHGLELLPNRLFEYNGVTLREFDIDGAIRRKPQLLLVDELAHTNAEGSRHTKRYQDIEELLRAGMDVYTTVNVQHIESLNDLVASITGILVRERIPDSVFDDAAQVELVDIEPQDLIARLNSGNVYRAPQARQAVENFFTVENLTALREIAMRRCADRINILTENSRIKNNGDYPTDEHILVCLSSSPSNARVIRTAARMANAFRGAFTALFVETLSFPAMDEKDKRRLRSNMRLAEQLGAKIETVHGEDVPLQIAEFARLSGVSKIVIGRSSATRRHLFGKPTLTEKVIAYAPNLEVHIIPDTATAASAYRARKLRRKKSILLSATDTSKSAAVLAVCSLIGIIFQDYLGFAEATIILVYVLGVLCTSVITTHRIYSLISSIVSVVVFNFLFVEPKYTLYIYDQNYAVTFVIMFLAAFLTGSLAVRLKNQAMQTAQSAYRTKVLFDTNQLLQHAKSREEIVSATCSQLLKLLGKDLVFYLAEGAGTGTPHFFPTTENASGEKFTTDKERAVAEWVLKNNKRAGATTDTLPNAKCLYLAVRVNSTVYGVVGIVINGQPLDAFENSILSSIRGECALALENEKNAREKDEAALLAKNEQLRANLLRAISHDLRTPLAGIMGTSEMMMGMTDPSDERYAMAKGIYKDADWLTSLVENILRLTRLQNGDVRITKQPEPAEEVVSVAVRAVEKRAPGREIAVSVPEEVLMVPMDAKLIDQVLINILDNAMKFTPPGKEIRVIVDTDAKKENAIFTVADRGKGIAPEDLPNIFRMFYTTHGKCADSQRGIGIGLSICESIVKAHGGTIRAQNRRDGPGSIITFTLPLNKRERQQREHGSEN